MKRFLLVFSPHGSLTDVLDGTSITEMCILLMWAFRLPSFLNTQLQSMHGNRGTPLVCGIKGIHMRAVTACEWLLNIPFCDLLRRTSKGNV